MQGLILLNKPSGITSFGTVAKIKRAAHEKRVGHTGTLDPMATGVLPVLLGRATALSGLMLDADKRYTATVRLGVATDTDDITGTVIKNGEVNVTSERLNNAVSHFTGEIMQRPPAYSALKKDGVRLYTLARKGETVEVPERRVTVFSADVVSYINEKNEFTVNFHVSKGTYIRSLARDIGEFLGCGACLSSLCRTYTGGFSLSQCVSPDALNERNISEYILSEEKAVEYLKEVQVTKKQAVRFSNGGQLGFERLRGINLTENELVRVKCEKLFLGIGRADIAKDQLAVKCVINYPGDGI
ncbi:MAG TPA: tRNA pseudouridine(55) synthase TruB [Ruminococcaceae bacterium]|nr:tRNA pseudouridine(55) synthase TruB [Oscillospiraceae bacterium]